MNQESRRTVVDRMLEHRVSAIIRTQDQQLAAEAMRAAVDGGFRMVEFTLTTPGALELVRQFSADDRLVVGAGTVLTRDAARAAVAQGAKFLVSPVFDPAIVEEAARLGVGVMPGTFTPTELELAHRAGADFVKLFPAPPGGVEYILAIRAPLPHLRIFPTAGVSVDNVTDFLNAGCAGAGFVRNLFHPEDMQRRDFEAIRHRAAAITRRVATWKASKSGAPAR